MTDKRMIYTIVAGIVFGLFVLLLNSIFYSIDSTPLESQALHGENKISYQTVDNQDHLLTITLDLFGLNSAISDNSGDSLLSKNVSIRIIAQATLGGIHNTKLEITSGDETKQIQVQEGSIVNGLLIKSINDKQLIVEKDSIEHTVKLFHPKELNSTNIDSENDPLQ